MQHQTPQPKEPWLAVWLSALCPGIGQIYAGKRQRGIFFIVCNISLFLLICANALGFLCDPSKKTIRLLIFAIFWLALSGLFELYCLWDAYRMSHQYNQDHNFILPSRKKEPFLSSFLSWLLPGLGHIYNSEWMKGLSIIILMFICSTAMKNIPLGKIFFSLLQIPISIWILSDAFRVANRLNGNEQSLWQRFGMQKIVLVISIWFLMNFLASASLTFLIRTYFLTPYKIPTPAMSSTLKPGDRIFSNKWIYRSQDPKRGDIIIFKYPPNPRKDYIKRVVGLPGETLVIKDGNVYANGTLIDTPEIPKERRYQNREDWQYGKSDQIIEIPQNSYFVLGDNSAQSSDSRNWGFVPRKNIKGKAIYVWWPWERHRKL